MVNLIYMLIVIAIMAQLTFALVRMVVNTINYMTMNMAIIYSLKIGFIISVALFSIIYLLSLLFGCDIQ